MKYLFWIRLFAGQTYFSHLLSNGENVFGVNRSQPHDHVMWPWRDNIDLSDRWLSAHVVNDLDVILNFIDSIRPNIIIDFMGQGMVAPSWGSCIVVSYQYYTEIQDSSPFVSVRLFRTVPSCQHTRSIWQL